MIGNIIIWIVVGAIAGWLASKVMKTSSTQSLSEDIIVGVIGGFLGGLVLDILNIGGEVSGINPGSILVAFIGAVLFLVILKKVRGTAKI
ncbi:MAG: GlsB/YeaQ/YmgE family stress response membrane protein [Anaerolineales bacterium]|nr:GlsB/YeaQ/YmgE family stress response membrane protein [Anaerolineales bacterium]